MGDLMRFWLTRWEWRCCGTPFVVGDEVTFTVARRGPSVALAEELGHEIADTIDVVESHHDDATEERISGVVRAVWAVTMRTDERQVLRRPGRGAPPGATMPANGEEWPGRIMELGGGWTARTQPSRFISVTTTIPGSAASSLARGVDRGDSEATAEISSAPDADERRSVEGWLVDLATC